MKSAAPIVAAIVFVVVILAATVVILVNKRLPTTDANVNEQTPTSETALNDQIDPTQALQSQVNDLAAKVETLQLRIDALEQQRFTGDVSNSSSPDEDSLSGLEFEEGAVPTTEALGEQMKLAKERFNKGIIQPKNSFMLETLGQPRENYSTTCQPATSPRLLAALETRQIGSFNLTMLRPALDSVQRIMDRLQSDEPEIYAALGTAGALCARFIRGSTTSVSNHSWGAAVDLTLEGNLDAMGDGGTQFGLVILAEYFNDEGWYWGAGYGREDSMHFEVGEDQLKKWIADGLL